MKLDKRKVIAAYRRGFITIQECAQIIGVDKGQIARLLNDPQLVTEAAVRRNKRSVTNL